MISMPRLLLFLLVLGTMTSCMVSRDLRSLQIEVYKTGIFELPKDLKTIVIINRDIYRSDTCVFRYFNRFKKVTDQSIKYKELSNRCVDVLAMYLKEKGDFQNVINLRDSLDGISEHIQDKFSTEEYFKKTKADICVFLNQFNIGMPIINSNHDLVHIEPSLYWSVEFKNDDLAYLYHQTDTLNFFKSEFPNLFETRLRIKPFISQASYDLSILFGARLIPAWQNVERMYYRSKNPDMLKAEKYALKNEWLRATEIWKKHTKNKNSEIAGKASYNMALACEMEGRPDLAIDWLKKSVNGMGKYNEEHNAICKEYLDVLAIRKKEIEQLDLQVRKSESGQ